MRLTKSQLRKIIAEELVREAGPDPERVDTSMIEKAIETSGEIEDAAHDAAGDIVSRFARKVIAPTVAKLLRQHAMDMTHGGHEMAPGWTPQTVEELEESDPGMMDDQMECASDIAFALMKLAQMYGKAAAAATAKARDEY